MSDHSGTWRYSNNCRIPEGQSLPSDVKRIAVVIEYDGSAFCGWQKQKHSAGVQQSVESALSKVAGEPVMVSCAGRTDTGVHATNQVIHFDTRARRNPRNWILGTNANLPPEVRLHWAGEVAPQFHARYSARSRTYRYLIDNSPQRPALFSRWLTWERRVLDPGRMQAAARFLQGERDFSSFRAAGCQSHSPMRNIHYTRLWSENSLIVMEIRANAFLHHMVRNIAGALIAVGVGEREPEWIGELLALKDRTLGEVTAPASGLYLVHVAYPARFGLPELVPGPRFVHSGLQVP